MSSNKKKVIKHLYFSQTQDDLHMIMFCGTLDEVAKHYGVKPQSIRKVICVYRQNGWDYCPYGVVSFKEEDFEEGEEKFFYTDLTWVNVLGGNRRDCKTRRISKGSPLYEKARKGKSNYEGK